MRSVLLVPLKWYNENVRMDTPAVLKRFVCGAIVLALLVWSDRRGPPSAAETAFPPLLSSELDTLYATAYDETIGRHVLEQRDGTTYVSTGDIRAEWLRDASAIVRPVHRALAPRRRRRQVAARGRRAPGTLHPDRPLRQRLFRRTTRSSRRSSRSIRCSIRSGSRPTIIARPRTPRSSRRPSGRRSSACCRSCTSSSTTTSARTTRTRSWRAAAAAARCATPAWSGPRSGPRTIRCAITTTSR